MKGNGHRRLKAAGLFLGLGSLMGADCVSDQFWISLSDTLWTEIALAILTSLLPG